jgi:hypothetical protein
VALLHGFQLPVLVSLEQLSNFELGRIEQIPLLQGFNPDIMKNKTLINYVNI